MQGLEIGVIAFIAIIFGGLGVWLFWAKAKGNIRVKEFNAMAEPIGFKPITKPPLNFPLSSFPVVRWGQKGGRIFSLAFQGEYAGREVLFFNYMLMQQQRARSEVTPVVAQTIIAVQGGTDCFPTAQNDPTLHLKTAEAWTIAYRHKTFMTAAEVQSLVTGIPYSNDGRLVGQSQNLGAG